MIHNLPTKGEIHETLQICKSLTKRQIQYFNNVGCHSFEFATPYRALPSFVNDPLIVYPDINNENNDINEKGKQRSLTSLMACTNFNNPNSSEGPPGRRRSTNEYRRNSKKNPFFSDRGRPTDPT
jgi:hypothetical protein